MGHIIIIRRVIVRRGMKRTIEDLGDAVTNPVVHDICNKPLDQWSPSDVLIVQTELDRHKAE